MGRQRLLRHVLVLLALVFVARSVPAGAHTLWLDPKPRDNQDGHKPDPAREPTFVLPCGIPRAANQPVTKPAWSPGQRRTVRWEETVSHEGCFLIDFSENDQVATPVFQRLTVVKRDHHGTYMADITLPNVECSQCVLRIRQIMLGTAAEACPPAGMKDLDYNLYYSCANVVLSKSGADASVPDAKVPDAAASKDTSGSGGAGGGSGGSGGGGSGGTTGTGGGSGTADAGNATTHRDGGGGCSLGGRRSECSLLLAMLGLLVLAGRRSRGTRS